VKLLVNGQDYSAALVHEPALTIERRLNKPQQCSFSIDCDDSGLAYPARNQTVAVIADDGAALFNGYLVTDPVLEYAGQTTAGPRYRLHLAAWSEEYALDRQPLPWMRGGVNLGAGAMLTAMTSRLSAQGISTTGVAAGPTVGQFQPDVGGCWSANAGALAASARMAYRVSAGAMALSPVGAVTHSLDGATLRPSSLQLSSTRTLANDVTVSGAEEPGEFALELFEGDGTTTVFDLTRAGFSVKGEKIVDEGFTLSALNSQVWQISDPGSNLAIGSNGLVIAGGTGTDGQTTLCAIDPVELGGSIVVEAGNVVLAANSAGLLGGLYSGAVNLGNCFAGFRVRTSGGALLLVAVVNGSEVGTIYTLTPSHAYTLRIRLHFPELVRSLATYYSVGTAGVVARGGGLTNSAGYVEFELQDSASAPNTPATVLYDGVVASAPATAVFGAVNSVALVGSAGYFTVKRPSTAWVTSIPPMALERTRRVGQAAEGAECKVTAGTGTTPGKLTFYAAAVPASGELIKVRYRTTQRSVARLANAASQTLESAGQPANGIPGVAQWTGKVEKPEARCSADCEAAAAAVLDFSTSRAAAWEATVTGANLHQQSSGDVWPGDVVSLAAPFASANDAAQAATFIVRSVKITNASGKPEQLEYALGLANEWADGLSLTLNNTVAADAVLPAQPAPAVNAVSANLPLVDVATLTSTSLTVTVNATAPSGGGFEVRRQDADFGNGVAPNRAQQGLVVRSSVATFTLPRAAELEQFFLRMYDGSTPPLYSRVSAAIFTNVPLS
jgi:hypothetical protein